MKFIVKFTHKYEYCEDHFEEFYAPNFKAARAEVDYLEENDGFPEDIEMIEIYQFTSDDHAECVGVDEIDTYFTRSFTKYDIGEYGTYILIDDAGYHRSILEQFR